MRFLLVIRGAFIAAPANELPVIKIPHAAPITDKPIAHDIPIADHKYGFIRLNINPKYSQSMSLSLFVDFEKLNASKRLERMKIDAIMS